MSDFYLGKPQIGGGRRCFVIGEIAQAHDGSLGMAHAYIDAIARAGADAVKFQTHIAAAESSPQEPWRVKFSRQDASRFDYWKRMEFTEAQWVGLKEHAEECGLVFLSSPFSVESVALLERLDMAAWKVASGEINNPILMEQILGAGKPVLLSTGLTTYAEMDEVIEDIRGAGRDFAVMQCTTKYPTPPEELGLNLLSEFRERYQCPVGLSDHSANLFTGVAAASLGADLLETHVALSREMFGPDTVASLTTSELKTMIDGIRFVETAMANPMDKAILSEEQQELRTVFNKSLFVKMDLPAGTRLEPEHLIGKKPGTGIPVKQVKEVIGQRLALPVSNGEMLTYQHIHH